METTTNTEFNNELSHFHQHHEFYNSPVRLSKVQQDNPLHAIHNFFCDYRLADVRQQLWDWIEVALTTDNFLYSEASKRNSTLHFYMQIEKLVEAAYLIDLEGKKKKKSSKK